MALKTSEHDEERLHGMNFKICLMRELVQTPADHPIIRPSMNSEKMTYALAQMPAPSYMTGKTVNQKTLIYKRNEEAKGCGIQGEPPLTHEPEYRC